MSFLLFNYTVSEVADYVCETSVGTFQVDNDDIRTETKSCHDRRLLWSFGPVGFDEKSFIALLGFTPYWDYKPKNEYVSLKVTIINLVYQTLLECENVNATVVNWTRNPS